MSRWRAGLRKMLAELPREVSFYFLLFFDLRLAWFFGDGTDFRLNSPWSSRLDTLYGVATDSVLWLKVGDGSLYYIEENKFLNHQEDGYMSRKLKQTYNSDWLPPVLASESNLF